MIVSEARQWLNENRAEYEAATAKLSDPKFVRKLLEELRKTTIGLTGYNAFQHPVHAAVEALTEARISMSKVFTELDVIEQYEQYRDMVNEEGDLND